MRHLCRSRLVQLISVMCWSMASKHTSRSGLRVMLPYMHSAAFWESHLMWRGLWFIANGVTMGSKAFQIRGQYQGAMGGSVAMFSRHRAESCPQAAEFACTCHRCGGHHCCVKRSDLLQGKLILKSLLGTRHKVYHTTAPTSEDLANFLRGAFS